MAYQDDVRLVRDLAKQVADLAADPVQDERRELWRAHNSFERTRPLIICGWEAAWPEHPDAANRCEDPFLQAYETIFKRAIFRESLGDDTILEPWVVLRATLINPPNGIWGVGHTYKHSGVAGGSWKHEPALKQLSDLERMIEPRHDVDKAATAASLEKLQDAIGDIMPIAVDRSPIWSGWWADLSTALFYLRGLDQLMLDMHDNPAWLHDLLSFMSRGILKAQAEAEAAGDYSLINGGNQAMCYSRELPDPANAGGVKRDQLWDFCAAQEYALVGPRHHDEFLLRYQLPIIEKYGLSAYGCCEDLTHKIDMLRQIKNLRRISVTPVADPGRNAEQIGTDYVISWRPNPAEMICCGFDQDKVKRIVRDAMEAMKGCHVDVHLKDVQTVNHHPELLRDWVRIVREITDEYA